MRQLSVRAVLITLLLLAVVFLLSPNARASSTKENFRNPPAVDSARALSLPGCESHRKAFREIQIGMDLKDVSDLIAGLLDRDKEGLQISIEDDPSNVTLIWVWQNTKTDNGILTGEVSKLRVLVDHFKVVVVGLDYNRLTLDGISEEGRLKGSRGFVEKKPNPGTGQGKK